MNIDTKKLELVRYRMTVGAFNTVNASVKHDGMWVQYENAKDVESALIEQREENERLREALKGTMEFIQENMQQDHELPQYVKTFLCKTMLALYAKDEVKNG